MSSTTNFTRIKFEPSYSRVLQSGAVDLCKRVGIEDILEWDMAETAKGGPFSEITDVSGISDTNKKMLIRPFSLISLSTAFT